MKIGANGKPHDPTTRAASAVTVLRSFIEHSASSKANRVILNDALDAIAERLEACSALAKEVEAQQAAHAALIREATEMLGFVRVLAVQDQPGPPIDRLLQYLHKIEDALMGISRTRKLGPL